MGFIRQIGVGLGGLATNLATNYVVPGSVATYTFLRHYINTPNAAHAARSLGNGAVVAGKGVAVAGGVATGVTTLGCVGAGLGNGIDHAYQNYNSTTGDSDWAGALDKTVNTTTAGMYYAGNLAYHTSRLLGNSAYYTAGMAKDGAYYTAGIAKDSAYYTAGFAFNTTDAVIGGAVDLTTGAVGGTIRYTRDRVVLPLVFSVVDPLAETAAKVATRGVDTFAKTVKEEFTPSTPGETSNLGKAATALDNIIIGPPPQGKTSFVDSAWNYINPSTPQNTQSGNVPAATDPNLLVTLGAVSLVAAGSFAFYKYKQMKNAASTTDKANQVGEKVLNPAPKIEFSSAVKA